MSDRIPDQIFFILLYIVLTISILIGQEPPVYFENSRDFVDKHDYSIIMIIKKWIIG